MWVVAFERSGFVEIKLRLLKGNVVAGRGWGALLILAGPTAFKKTAGRSENHM